ncbi:uncharacterized protein HMPREF1541_00570 [Cyphellophora europaea CBS 101466]|uniref:Uncharacterized protein n=1 Tax=Cyphellophora europaea (strain CBS 101466) TaxID=1220924 RepID=W2SCF5_CYPE1|nr:uncharacterized protein HMPREF1541_00570 [Cyphellophora europaea CBS 101466]ETN46386.1 hypothetical protein HMPREF1541_00570 [Cyphellophora europaea CBS 101466]
MHACSFGQEAAAQRFWDLMKRLTSCRDDSGLSSSERAYPLCLDHRLLHVL